MHPAEDSWAFPDRPFRKSRDGFQLYSPNISAETVGEAQENEKSRPLRALKDPMDTVVPMTAGPRRGGTRVSNRVQLFKQAPPRVFALLVQGGRHSQR